MRQPTLYEPQVHRKPQPRKPHAAMRERFYLGVPLGFVWQATTTCAVWRVWRLPLCRYSVN